MFAFLRKTSPYKTLVSIDFDGVLYSYGSGGAPVPGAAGAVLRYLDAGLDVAVYSARSRNLAGRWAMRRWLGDQIADHWEAGGGASCLAGAECRSDAAAVVRRVKWPWFKPEAHLAIDYRAVTFLGDWDDPGLLPQAVYGFCPWNKAGPARRATTEAAVLCAAGPEAVAAALLDARRRERRACADEVAGRGAGLWAEAMRAGGP